MKIGIVSGFVDFRNDLREFVRELGGFADCVMFVPAHGQADWGPRLKEAGFEARAIEERTDGFRNRVVKKLFSLFMRLPASRNNYYLMELFKVAQIKEADQRLEAKAILDRRMRLPHFFRYDRFLRMLRPAGNTRCDDIDCFLFITEVCSDGFLAKVLRGGKPCHAYLYSWDHAFKHCRFTLRTRYLAWNDGAVEDLREMHGIRPEQVAVIGSTQLGFMERFRSLGPSERPFAFRYICFGCAIALPQLIAEEMKIVREIARLLEACAPEMKLVVRPYPILGDWGVYQGLRELPNVVMDDGFRKQGNAVSNQDINSKFVTIEHSEGFFHLGTTLGLESALTGAPSFLIDYGFAAEQAPSVDDFVHQTQNDKYIHGVSGRNVIRSEGQLRTLLTDLGMGRKQDYLEANRAIAARFPVRSFREIAQAAFLEMERR
ncbi:MAG: hypothetical protein ABIW76_13075 [Fibrobacteria bacterium]